MSDIDVIKIEHADDSEIGTFAAPFTIKEGSLISMEIVDDKLVITASSVPSPAPARTLIQTYKSYFVRTDGNDTNDGSSNDSAHAFATLQRAVDAATKEIDADQWIVLINVEDGTYNAGAVIPDVLGGSILNFIGNWQHPGNVLIQTDATAFYINVNQTTVNFDGFKVEASNGDGFDVQGGGPVLLEDFEFGDVPNGAHVYVHNNGLVQQYADWKISGSAQRHIRAEDGGIFEPFESAWWANPYASTYVNTLTGTPGFSIAFADCRTGGQARFYAQSFSGSATGKRFIVQSNSHIGTGGHALTWLPGDTAGELDGTGTYDDTVSAALIGTGSAPSATIYLEPELPEEPFMIPGPEGKKGDTGGIGPAGGSGVQGPPGVALILEPDPSEDPMMIPGPIGATGATGAAGGRTQLTQNTTYYVRTDGNDSNDGSANNSGHAWLTLQHAISVYQSLDCNGYDVTISVADGTWTAGMNITGRQGAGNLYLTGNATTPANCVINATSSNCLGATGHPMGSIIYFNGFKLTTTTSGQCIYAAAGSQIYYHNIEFGSCAGYHILVQGGASLVLLGNCKISGGAGSHVLAQTQGGWFNGTSGVTITITGTPAFSLAFFYISTLAIAAISNTVTWSGSATGKRYVSDSLSIINTNGSSSTYLPGNASGTTSNGGLYV